MSSSKDTGKDKENRSKKIIKIEGKKIEIKGNALSLQDMGLSTLEDIEGIHDLQGIKSIYFQGNKFKEIPYSEAFKNVSTANFSKNDIEDICKIAKYIQLEEVVLDDNQIEDIEGLSGLKHLKTALLQHNDIKSVSLENLESLETLSLAENHLTQIGSLNLPSLKQLCFGGNKIRNIRNLENLTNLETLGLNGNNIEEISGLSSCEKLRYLDLSHNNIKQISGLEKLKALETILLSNNPIQYLSEIVLTTQKAQEIVQYCEEITNGIRKREKPPHEIYTKEKLRELIKGHGEEFFRAIGTHREYEKLKGIQNYLFMETTPDPIYLGALNLQFNSNFWEKKGWEKKKLWENLNNSIRLYICQLYSMKGFNDDGQEDKIDHFLSFTKQFWDKQKLEEEHILSLKEGKETHIIEFINLILDDDFKGVKVIIFPENSIPVNFESQLVEIAKKNSLIIIGGIEHMIIPGENYYCNKALIIDKGRIDYQVKQTPVEIFNKETNKSIVEGIPLKKFPQIKIFNTRIGRIAIFICKDFLRLQGVISYWARTNQVDLIVVPSLTSKVLPFHLHLNHIFNYKCFKNLKIVFANIGEYGGSEFFSLKTKWDIETKYSRGIRDNIGERIVIRNLEPFFHPLMENLNAGRIKNILRDGGSSIILDPIKSVTTDNFNTILKNLKKKL